MHMVIATTAWLILTILSCNSYADEVVFENGERLIGTFQQVEGNKLIFKSESRKNPLAKGRLWYNFL
jgi:hypothetical protein